MAPPTHAPASRRDRPLPAHVPPMMTPLHAPAAHRDRPLPLMAIPTRAPDVRCDRPSPAPSMTTPTHSRSARHTLSTPAPSMVTPTHSRSTADQQPSTAPAPPLAPPMATTTARYQPPPSPHPRRPPVVVNPYPERQTGMRTVPGEKKYSEAHRRKVLLITDSIWGGIKRPEMMEEFKHHEMDIDFSIRRHAGGQSHELFHHAQRSIADERPDGLIIVCGTNDLPRRDGRRQLTNDEIAANLLATGVLARELGVSKVFISGITYRKGAYYEQRIRGINKILKVGCIKQGFNFIDNDNIESYHTDGLHLNKEGTSLLKLNFIASFYPQCY